MPSKPSITSVPGASKKDGSRKSKFCMFHFQGVCKYSSDSCLFAHSVDEIHHAVCGKRRSRGGTHSASAAGRDKEHAAVSSTGHVEHEELNQLHLRAETVISTASKRDAVPTSALPSTTTSSFNSLSTPLARQQQSASCLEEPCRPWRRAQEPSNVRAGRGLEMSSEEFNDNQARQMLGMYGTSRAEHIALEEDLILVSQALERVSSRLSSGAIHPVAPSSLACFAGVCDQGPGQMLMRDWQLQCGLLPFPPGLVGS
eukprot:TRINITY_DN12318_c0_g2_i1.p1 TRINITY_DN12318_c0_g2~~TRINITY_DN12318_c0_g2_i1.p1  ORF type:complete len:257 (+),score=33.38 TRINITY_DN12318_c0_g2_i1:64-834(+)